MRFKNGRDVNFYVNLAACVLSLVTAVTYAVYAPTNKTLLVEVVVLMLAGTASSAVLVLKDIFLLPVVPAACWSMAFAIFLQDRLMMFGDYANGLPGLSGGGNIIELVIALMVMMVACVAAEIFTCFKKSAPAAEEA